MEDNKLFIFAKMCKRTTSNPIVNKSLNDVNIGSTDSSTKFSEIGIKGTFKILELDILKFIFSIVVCFHHWSFHGFATGYLAVEFFFIISGYFFTNAIITKHMYGGGIF